jgi:hypothetical protein
MPILRAKKELLVICGTGKLHTRLVQEKRNFNTI